MPRPGQDAWCDRGSPSAHGQHLRSPPQGSAQTWAVCSLDPGSPAPKTSLQVEPSRTQGCWPSIGCRPCCRGSLSGGGEACVWIPVHPCAPSQSRAGRQKCPLVPRGWENGMQSGDPGVLPGRLPGGGGPGTGRRKGPGPGLRVPPPPQGSTAPRTWTSATSSPTPARTAAPATTPWADTTACASTAGRARTAARTLTTAPAPPASTAPPATTAWPPSTASVPTAALVRAGLAGGASCWGPRVGWARMTSPRYTSWLFRVPGDDGPKGRSRVKRAGAAQGRARWHQAPG